jgi:hypothetical protein
VVALFVEQSDPLTNQRFAEEDHPKAAIVPVLRQPPAAWHNQGIAQAKLQRQHKVPSDI